MKKLIKQLYTRRMVSSFSDELCDIEGHKPLQDPFRLSVDISPVTELFNRAFKDQDLQLNHAELPTPLGVNSKQKYELVKILEWLCLFKIFQEGATLSFNSTEFARYEKQKHWYLLASEHGQVQCLVSEVVLGRPSKPQSFKSMIVPNEPLRANYENLVSNSCVIEPLQALISYLENNSDYDEYLKIYSDLPIQKLAQQVSQTLQQHYEMATQYEVTCGGLVFEWYSANPGNAKAFGLPFRHQKLIEDYK